jgi:hypothetical protein
MIQIASVNNRTSGVVKALSLPWDKLSARFAKCEIGDKDGSGWMPANIEPGPRTAERVKSISLLVLDVEADAENVKDADGKPLLDSNGDHVKRYIGPEPPAPDAMIAELGLWGWRCILHTSYSHSPEHPRYRMTFALSRVLTPAEVKPLGLHVAALIGIGDCIDTGAIEPARLFYLPRCPAERESLFRHAATEGEPLPVDEFLTKAAAIKQAQKSATAGRRTGQSGTVIQAFNDGHDVGAILEQHGYEQRGRRRWIWPGSTTGLPGVRLLPDSTPERVYSSHGGDPLNDGHAHDAFDLWRILKHGGDVSAAVKDAAHMMGMEGQRGALAGLSAPARAAYQSGDEFAPAGDSDAWPEPQPLAVKVEAEPYPIDALPGTIRAAVEEVARFVKAPLPMVASSALAALSLAAQAHVDAKRAERLQGPVGLFLLTIADSGERKSTCDGFFVSAIRQYQEEQAEAMKPTIKEYQAAIAAWEAERDGIISAIKQAGKTAKPVNGKDIKALRAELAEHQHQQPEPPRVPRLLLGDETPENLSWGLAKQWPSAGVVSAEAGIVFGAHGMGKDSVMRNLGLLNVLWDGGSHSVGRRTSESFTVKGARLTVALQIQEMTLRSFFDRSGGLARGTGFLARFLVAWPESTQGYRPFTEAPPNWPHLAAFHKRIAAILANPVPMDEEGALSPALMMLTPEAKAAWVAFHDAIESELASGGEFYDVRDVASKSADNAARLGALFQLFEHGMGGAVGLDCFDSASLIAAWHLHESRRFFGELALPAELVDAARLDSWLIEYCKRERTHLVPIAKLQQGGPGGLRSKVTIETALRELEDASRARLVRDGKRRMIAVNPALVIEGGA